MKLATYGEILFRTETQICQCGGITTRIGTQLWWCECWLPNFSSHWLCYNRTDRDGVSAISNEGFAMMHGWYVDPNERN